MPKNAQAQEQLFGFLGFYQTVGQDGYLGALLITNVQGVPQEFRCTLPVRPTVVQRPLFGAALEPYIGVDLCGVRLIESVDHKPALIVVNKPFLTQIRPRARCPVIYVEKAGERLEIKPQGGQADAGRKERLESPTGRFQPVVYSAHPDYQGDLNSAGEMLDKASHYLDPMEPFDRIDQAIQMLAKQDARYR